MEPNASSAWLPIARVSCLSPEVALSEDLLETLVFNSVPQPRQCLHLCGQYVGA